MISIFSTLMCSKILIAVRGPTKKGLRESFFSPGLFWLLKYYIWGVLSYVKAAAASALWECLKINLGKYWRHKIFPLPCCIPNKEHNLVLASIAHSHKNQVSNPISQHFFINLTFFRVIAVTSTTFFSHTQWRALWKSCIHQTWHIW